MEPQENTRGEVLDERQIIRRARKHPHDVVERLHVAVAERLASGRLDCAAVDIIEHAVAGDAHTCAPVIEVSSDRAVDADSLGS